MAKHRRTEASGRSAPEQFMGLPYVLVKSLAWRSLTGSALKVLIELYSRYNGQNNGTLCLSFADAKKKLGIGNATIKRAFVELQNKGFIRLTEPGHWYGRKAAEWAVTHKSWQGNLPSNDWKNWRPTKTAAKTEVAPETEYTKPQYVP